MAERLGKYKADKEAMGRTLQSIYDDPDLTMEQKIAAANKVQRSMMFSGGGLGDLDLDVTGDAGKKQKKTTSTVKKSFGGGGNTSKVANVLAGGDPQAAQSFQSIWDETIMPLTSFFNPNAGKTAFDWYSRRLGN